MPQAWTKEGHLKARATTLPRAKRRGGVDDRAGARSSVGVIESSWPVAGRSFELRALSDRGGLCHQVSSPRAGSIGVKHPHLSRSLRSRACPPPRRRFATCGGGVSLARWELLVVEGSGDRNPRRSCDPDSTHGAIAKAFDDMKAVFARGQPLSRERSEAGESTIERKRDRRWGWSRAVGPSWEFQSS
jgi:hypothetical protein